MGSIRILNDGDRFYIVFENPTEDDKKAALEFVSKRLGIKQNVEKPEGVYPAKVEPYKIPENLEEIDVKTKKVIIPYINSPSVFIKWYLKYEELDKTNQKKLLQMCQAYIQDYFKKVHRDDIVAVKKFLVDFSPMFENTTKEILKKNGYNNLKAFLNTEGEANIQAVFDVYKKGLYNSLGINQ